MTLGEYLKGLRDRRGLSLAEVAAVPGLQRATVWKVENGHLPKGKTLTGILDGLGAKPDSADYREAIALWTNQRTRGGLFRPNELAGILDDQTEANRELMREFLAVVSGLDARDFAALLAAARRPAVLHALNALHQAEPDGYSRRDTVPE